MLHTMLNYCYNSSLWWYLQNVNSW
jgi:hypothetical protein